MKQKVVFNGTNLEKQPILDHKILDVFDGHRQYLTVDIKDLKAEIVQHIKDNKKAIKLFNQTGFYSLVSQLSLGLNALRAKLEMVEATMLVRKLKYKHARENPTQLKNFKKA